MTSSDELTAIAERLVDQRDEPWPFGSEANRLHYWRDKAIEAARKIEALTRSNDERGLISSMKAFVAEHARGVPMNEDRQGTAIILIDEAIKAMRSGGG